MGPQMPERCREPQGGVSAFVSGVPGLLRASSHLSFSLERVLAGDRMGGGAHHAVSSFLASQNQPFTGESSERFPTGHLSTEQKVLSSFKHPWSLCKALAAVTTPQESPYPPYLAAPHQVPRETGCGGPCRSNPFLRPWLPGVSLLLLSLSLSPLTSSLSCSPSLSPLEDPLLNN